MPGGQVTEFDFLTKAPSAGGAYALPGAVAGFATMQKLYGALPWQRVVAPGEAYAATGFPISQALAARLVSAQNILRLDASLAAEFLDQNRRAACGRRGSQEYRAGPDPEPDPPQPRRRLLQGRCGGTHRGLFRGPGRRHQRG